MQNTSTSSDRLAQSAKLSAKEVIVASPALNVNQLELRQKEGEVPEGLLPEERIGTWHGTRLQQSRPNQALERENSAAESILDLRLASHPSSTSEQTSSMRSLIDSLSSRSQSPNIPE